MEIDIYSSENKPIGNTSLSPEVFACEYRADILHQVVTWQLAKRRLGTHQTKEVGDIQASTRKIYAQKGTGRARHGSVKAPQFRGGATVFGPHFRDHGFKLNKKVLSLALRVALSSKLHAKELFVLDSFADLSSGKTKDALRLAATFGSDSILLVTADRVPEFLRAVANLHKIDVLPVVGLNVYDILHHRLLLITTEAVKLIEGRLKR